MLASILDRRFARALELGAGDGSQSVTIAKFCDELVCTEYLDDPERFKARDIPHASYLVCDATNLSQFNDHSFDFVFSSNMLEHIPDWKACLTECKRVLAPGGFMVHVMPSRDWKIWNTIGRLLHRQLPEIHGVETNHLSEYREFGEASWIKRFHSVGLGVDALVRMPFYHGNGPTLVPLIRIGNWLGWKSSTAFIVKI